MAVLPDLLDGVSVGDVDPDVVRAASAQVRGLCGWHVAPLVTEDVRLPWDASGRYLLPSLRVEAVNSVSVGGVAVQFDWSPNGMLMVQRGLFGAFPSANGPAWLGGGLRGLVVNITHGYEVCPDDVRQAVLTRATQLGAQRVRSQAQGVGPYSQSITYFDADVASDLAPYRLPAVA